VSRRALNIRSIDGKILAPLAMSSFILGSSSAIISSQNLDPSAFCHDSGRLKFVTKMFIKTG
jgi:hypothetical protein